MFRNLLNLLLVCTLFVSQQANANKLLITPASLDTAKMHHWCDSVFDTMTLNERIGQLFMPIVDVKSSAPYKNLLKKYVEQYHVGGILYSKGKLQEQAQLTNWAQGLAPVPLMISLDGEWGLAMRLTDAPRFPRNMMLGAVTNDSLIYAYGEAVGRHCKEMGIHVNFAPVLDVNSNPKNPVIGTRAFGETVDLVTKKGIAYARGLEQQGVMAVGKHFPGHGDTADDSHHTLPELRHDSLRMYDFEMKPFRDYIDHGLSGMLTAHLSVPSLDPSRMPSSLSKKIIQDILIDEFGFEGLVFTDGLAMKGVSTQPDFCVKAILAGNDILLGPANMSSAVTSVRNAVSKGVIPVSLIEERCRKILKYKYILGVHKRDTINENGLVARLNNPATKMLNRQLHAEAITLLRNEDQILPLKGLDKNRIACVTVGDMAVSSFQNMLQQYNKHACYAVSRKSTAQQFDQVAAAARKNDLLIVGVSSTLTADRARIERLVAGKKYVLVFFTTPYRLSSFKSLIAQSQAVVLAYETSALAAEAAAQLLYGGIDAKGKLSVSIPGLYPAGTGLSFSANRLGYAIPEEVGVDSRTLAEIDEIVAEGIKDKAFPGCQILVAKDSKIIYQKSFGHFDYAHTHPVEDQDIYDLASVSKAIATVPAVMRMRDQYQVKTVEPLSKYIPELNTPDKKNITIQQTLFHETGLPSGAPFYRMTMNIDSLKAPLFKAVRDVNYRLQVDEKLYAHKDVAFLSDWISSKPSDRCCLPVADNIYNRADFRDSVICEIGHMTLKNRGRYRYSCLNFVLLRELVENVTKTHMDQYLYNSIYRPLGATSLLYNPLDKGWDKHHVAPTENDQFIRRQLLVGHVHDEIAAFSGGVEGNAGLFGNARDIAKVLQLLLNEGEYGGERLLSTETVRLFTMSKSPRSRRGLGFDKPDMRNPRYSPAAADVPASLFGHTGFTGTMFWADPDNDLIYIFLTNRVYPHRWNKKLMRDNYRTRIQECIYDAI